MVVILVLQFDVHMIDFSLQPSDFMSVFEIESIFVGLPSKDSLFRLTMALPTPRSEPYQLNLHLIYEAKKFRPELLVSSLDLASLRGFLEPGRPPARDFVAWYHHVFFLLFNWRLDWIPVNLSVTLEGSAVQILLFGPLWFCL